MAAFDFIELLRLKNTLRSVKVSPGPNSPLLFIIVFWGETKPFADVPQNTVGVLKNFETFIVKH